MLHVSLLQYGKWGGVHKIAKSKHHSRAGYLEIARKYSLSNVTDLSPIYDVYEVFFSFQNRPCKINQC